MRSLALLVLMLSSALARAEAPMVTEHSDPLALGECEWELYSERLRSEGSKAHGWSTNAGCGLARNLDLGLGICRWRGEGGSERLLELYGRWRFVEGGDAGPSLALVYGAEGLKTAERGWRHDTSSLLLAVDQPLGESLLARLNLGLAHSRLERQSTRRWALGLELSLGESLTLVTETYGAQRSKPWQGLGLRWQPLAGWSFGAMASRSSGQRGLLFSAQWID